MVSGFTGGQEYFVFTDESVYGDGGNFATNKTNIGQEVALNNPNFSMNWRSIDGGGDLQLFTQVVGEKSYMFDLEFIVDNFRFMKYVSAIDTETDNNGVFTHNLEIPHKDFNGSSFAFQRVFRKDDFALYFKGVKIMGLTFNAQKGSDRTGFLRVTARCIAQDIEIITNSANVQEPLTNTRKQFLFRDLLFTSNDNEIVEVNSLTYEYDWNVNPEDSRYANATLKDLIGEPLYVRLTHEITANLNVLRTDYITEFLNRQFLTGSNKIEFIDTNDNKLTFEFENVAQHNNIPPTQYGEVTKVDNLYVPTRLSAITIIDDIENY